MDIRLLAEMIHNKGEVREFCYDCRRRPLAPFWRDRNEFRELERGELTVTLEDTIVLETEEPSPDLRTGLRSSAITQAVQEVAEFGTDALALYKPFHLFPRRAWGIFVREVGLWIVAEELKGAPLVQRDVRLLQTAFKVLLEHELFHCMCEAAATLGELATGQAWYPHYFADQGSWQLEEALCNAAAFRLSARRPFRNNLRHWMQTQPDGYKDFERYLTCRSFRCGQRQLGQVMHGQTSRAPYALRDWPLELLWPERTGGTIRSVPVFLVLDIKHSSLRVGRPFPSYQGLRIMVFSNDHPPPHFHLFHPPHHEYGRYRWDNLAPLAPQDPPLSSHVRKRLEDYLDKYRSKIQRKIQQVYGPSAPRSTFGVLHTI